MFDGKSMETYSNTHLLINLRFCIWYSAWKIRFLISFAVTSFHLTHVIFWKILLKKDVEDFKVIQAFLLKYSFLIQINLIS